MLDNINQGFPLNFSGQGKGVSATHRGPESHCLHNSQSIPFAATACYQFHLFSQNSPLFKPNDILLANSMDSREPNQSSQSYPENGQAQVIEEMYQDKTPSQHRWHPVRTPLFPKSLTLLAGRIIGCIIGDSSLRSRTRSIRYIALDLWLANRIQLQSSHAVV